MPLARQKKGMGGVLKTLQSVQISTISARRVASISVDWVAIRCPGQGAKTAKRREKRHRSRRVASISVDWVAIRCPGQGAKTAKRREKRHRSRRKDTKKARLLEEIGLAPAAMCRALLACC